MTKASEIIEQSCCGQLLDDKAKLVKMVHDLECQVIFLNHRLENANAEIQRRPKR